MHSTVVAMMCNEAAKQSSEVDMKSAAAACREKQMKGLKRDGVLAC